MNELDPREDGSLPLGGLHGSNPSALAGSAVRAARPQDCVENCRASLGNPPTTPSTAEYQKPVRPAFPPLQWLEAARREPQRHPCAPLTPPFPATKKQILLYATPKTPFTRG